MSDPSSSVSDGTKINPLLEIIKQQREQRKAEEIANGRYNRDKYCRPHYLSDNEITRMEEERKQREIEVEHQLNDQELQEKTLEEKAQGLMHLQMAIVNDSTKILEKRNKEYEKMLIDQEKRRLEDEAYRKKREDIDREFMEMEREVDEMRERRIAMQKAVEQLKMQNVDTLHQLVLAEKKENKEKLERLQQKPIAEAEGDQKIVRNEEIGQIENPAIEPEEELIVPLNDIMEIVVEEEPEAVADVPRNVEVAAPLPQKRGRGRPPKRTLPVEPIAIAEIAPENELNDLRGNGNQEEVMDAVAEEDVEVAGLPPPKRGRGRPPKIIVPVVGNQPRNGDFAAPPPQKRGRGRPPKI